MCFSATASFVTAGVAGAIGMVSLTRANEPRELPLAATPIFFALQQSIEGLLWLNLPLAPGGSISTGLTFLYLFFAEVFWPAYAPIAVLLIEPNERRRHLMLICLAVGLGIGAYFLRDILIRPHGAVILDGHIVYVTEYRHSGAHCPLVSRCDQPIPYPVVAPHGCRPRCNHSRGLCRSLCLLLGGIRFGVVLLRSSGECCSLGPFRVVAQAAPSDRRRLELVHNRVGRQTRHSCSLSRAPGRTKRYCCPVSSFNMHEAAEQWPLPTAGLTVRVMIWVNIPPRGSVINHIRWALRHERRHYHLATATENPTCQSRHRP